MCTLKAYHNPSGSFMDNVIVSLPITMFTSVLELLDNLCDELEVIVSARTLWCSPRLDLYRRSSEATWLQDEIGLDQDLGMALDRFNSRQFAPLAAYTARCVYRPRLLRIGSYGK